VPFDGILCLLFAAVLLGKTILFNDETLDLTTDGSLPKLTGKLDTVGDLILAPQTITFIELPKRRTPIADNQAGRIPIVYPFQCLL
jgi:hypothetical protein